MYIHSLYSFSRHTLLSIAASQKNLDFINMYVSDNDTRIAYLYTGNIVFMGMLIKHRNNSNFIVNYLTKSMWH